MPRRPPSSADSSRPYTAGGFRPSNAVAAGGFDRDPQYTYSIDEEEEEEESDAEDLFAFLPPSTADQEQQYQQHTQSQLISSPGRQADLDQMFSVSVPPSDAAYISPPPPTFDPYARYPGDSAMGSSNPHSPYHSQPPVESPPSTDSQQHGADNPYQMRRFNRTTSSATRASGVNSREVHVALPSTFHRRFEEEDGSRSHGKQRSSITDTRRGTSMTPSMMEEDSQDGSVKMEFDFDAIEEEDSPYPEVRASVSNIDDPDMPALTLRMWFIGLSLLVVSSALNVFFNFRYPAPTIYPTTLLLISYPIGKFLAFSLPITTYRLPRFLGSIEFSLNPGPWNIKEHVLVYIMANVAVGSPYALNAIVVSELFYGIRRGFWFNTVLVLATQLTGFGLAGLCRQFLVLPASMVWPANLVTCTLLNTLHAEEDEGTGGLTRFRFFIYVLSGSFFFFFLPGYLFQALSMFSFVCWIVPNNIPANQLFGVTSGLGMSILTFDWTVISWIGSPLMIPWWAEVHIFVGFVLFYWILVPVLYYTNTWQFAHFPISANGPYDRFGQSYNVTRVLLPNDTFNETAYAEYSPLYLPATYAVTYLIAFALSTCVLVHTGLYHGRSLLNGMKKMKIEPDDIHAKLMKQYAEVPNWWYMLVLAFFFCMAIIAVEVWNTGIPVYVLLLAVLLPTVYTLPSGFIFAMTGQGISVNIVAQIIPGSLMPGNPMANMVFKAYSLQTLQESTNFVQDLKLGHYIKVSPRSTFIVQGIATVLAAFVQVGVKEWIFANIPDMCSPHQKDNLVCPHNQVFFTASVVWGLIGPSRQFGKGSLYYPQLYAIIVGAILPIPFWLWQRRYPSSWVKFISTPVVLNGVTFIPPATGINYSSWFAVGFIFQYIVRTRNFAWWSKFNYVASSALDSGTVLSLVVIFFTLQFPKGGSLTRVNWWGNTVFNQTADATRRPWHPVPPGGIPML